MNQELQDEHHGASEDKQEKCQRAMVTELQQQHDSAAAAPQSSPSAAAAAASTNNDLRVKDAAAAVVLSPHGIALFQCAEPEPDPETVEMRNYAASILAELRLASKAEALATAVAAAAGEDRAARARGEPSPDAATLLRLVRALNLPERPCKKSYRLETLKRVVAAVSEHPEVAAPEVLEGLTTERMTAFSVQDAAESLERDSVEFLARTQPKPGARIRTFPEEKSTEAYLLFLLGVVSDFLLHYLFPFSVESPQLRALLVESAKYKFSAGEIECLTYWNLFAGGSGAGQENLFHTGGVHKDTWHALRRDLVLTTSPRYTQASSSPSTTTTACKPSSGQSNETRCSVNVVEFGSLPDRPELVQYWANKCVIPDDVKCEVNLFGERFTSSVEYTKTIAHIQYRPCFMLKFSFKHELMSVSITETLAQCRTRRGSGLTVCNEVLHLALGQLANKCKERIAIEREKSHPDENKIRKYQATMEKFPHKRVGDAPALFGLQDGAMRAAGKKMLAELHASTTSSASTNPLLTPSLGGNDNTSSELDQALFPFPSTPGLAAEEDDFSAAVLDDYDAPFSSSFDDCDAPALSSSSTAAFDGNDNDALALSSSSSAAALDSIVVLAPFSSSFDDDDALALSASSSATALDDNDVLASSSFSGVANSSPKSEKRSQPKSSAVVAGGGGLNAGKWTADEHERFLRGLQQHGAACGAWVKIANVVKTRSSVQTNGHAQTYFASLGYRPKNAPASLWSSTSASPSVAEPKQQGADDMSRFSELIDSTAAEHTPPPTNFCRFVLTACF